MNEDFIKKWHKIREAKKTNIIAGLDPATFEMGRGKTGLPEGIDKRKWCLDFVEAVAPFVVGIKPNQAYFQGIGDRQLLKDIVSKIKKLNLIIISDNKVADIGSTNGAWFFYTKKLGFDAVTIASYAGNIEGGIDTAHEYGLGVISMGLMSNPEYASEMNFKNDQQEKLWHSRASRALKAGVDGLVVGGTYSSDNEDFQEFIKLTNNTKSLYLVPGIGFQGGSIQNFCSLGLDLKRCMINSGRGIMFPKGQNSSLTDQALAAKEARDTFNKESAKYAK